MDLNNKIKYNFYDESGENQRITAEDHFLLDGNDFSGIGHEMLKSQNQVTYPTQPTRQMDGSMLNFYAYESFILPKVEIGFKLIDMKTYLRLRRHLLYKRSFNVEYYDKDFDCIVKHKMYAEPDDLTAFLNIGEDILGLRDYTIRFIALLNDRKEFTASFESSVGITTLSNEWGRQIEIPASPTATNGYWKMTTENEYDAEVKFYPNEIMHIVKDCTFSWVEET